MHHCVAAKPARSQVKSPNWWDNHNLITGKFRKNEFVATLIDHMAKQDEPVCSNQAKWNFPRLAIGWNPDTPFDTKELRNLSARVPILDAEEDMTDEEISEGDADESYTAIWSLVIVPTAAAQEARGNPRVDELRERSQKDYSRLFSAVANKNQPYRGQLGTARIKLKPSPKVHRHRESRLQGERAQAMKKLLSDFIECGWIEPSDNEWASPEGIVLRTEKGEWRLVVDYQGLNEQTKHDSYSLPLMDTIPQKRAQKHIFTVLDLKHSYYHKRCSRYPVVARQ